MNNRKISILIELLERTKCECKGETLCFACNKIGSVFHELDDKGWIVK